MKVLCEKYNFKTFTELPSSDVFCLSEVREKFLLILSGYLLETT